MFVVGMGRLTDEVRLKSPWTLMFPEGIVISSESREQVEGMGLYTGEKRMKISRSNTEYMCVNDSVTVLQRGCKKQK